MQKNNGWRVFAFPIFLWCAAAGAAKNVTGDWLSPQDDNWPLIPIHAALTPDGRVLSYGTKGDGQQTGYFIYDVWDPGAGLSHAHATLDNLTQTDLFCSSQVILPQNGRVFLSGGDNWTGTGTTNTGNNNTNLFRYSDDSLTRGENMKRARWYGSTTVLANGEVYIQGGTGGNDRPEVRQLDATFRLLSNVDTSNLNYFYPRNFLLKDGRIFGYDVTGKMYYVNTAASGLYTSAGSFDVSHAGKTSSAAMYATGRILQFGGNSQGAIIIDVRGSSPVVTTTQSMSTKRMWVSGTILPDGKVLATGGSAKANELTGVNNAAEIWNPATGKWTLGASGSRARLYHSGALLLPDATVLVHGGGAPGPLVNLHAEIYYPPYLYNSSDGFRPRPSIQNAPPVIEPGVNFSVTSDSTNITRVTLLKFGAVTHSVNMDQRFLELGFSQQSTTSFIQSPAAADAPPGYYLLFLINDKGVPSVGSIVRINIPGGASEPPTDETPLVGGTGGNPFTVSCNSAEALVGVYGLANDTYIKKLGVRCAKVDPAGRWIGDPINRGATGGNSGTAFTKTCARDLAISGFKSRDSGAVKALNFECRSLDASGVLKGSGQFLNWVGPSGGTLHGPFRCSTDHPGVALGGRSSSRLDAFKLLCGKIP
jgi:hypothetical protein